MNLEEQAGVCTLAQEEDAILAAAARIIDQRLLRLERIERSADVSALIRLRLAGRTQEILFVLYLDNQKRVICVQEAFIGRISSCDLFLLIRFFLY